MDQSGSGRPHAARLNNPPGADGLAEVERTGTRNYTSFSVRGNRFGYYWPLTTTVGLKQTLSEQVALVPERPDVFEVQFTAGGFGWVVVHLPKIEADELTELVYEAWRLSAADALAEEQPFRQPETRSGDVGRVPPSTSWSRRRCF